jgi:hypothetical protein
MHHPDLSSFAVSPKGRLIATVTNSFSPDRSLVEIWGY